MPPCLNRNLGALGPNSTGDIYVVRILNETETVTMETSTTVADTYDQVGAMQFIICTVVVYSFLGVFFLLVIRFRQGTTAHQSARSDADAINNYLKSERSLKLEASKMKMITEIQKHAENIRNYEEKLKLLEIEKGIKAKDFGLQSETKRRGSRSFKIGRKMQKFTGRRHSTFGRRHSASGKRRLSTPDAFGQMGFSFLFMESKEPNEETIPEEGEDFVESTKTGEDCTVLLQTEMLPKSQTYHAFPETDLDTTAQESGTENEYEDIQYIDS